MTRARTRLILNCTGDILLLLFVAWVMWLGIVPLTDIIAQFGAGR